jgi:ribosomal-protein-serine acetyltransferase
VTRPGSPPRSTVLRTGRLRLAPVGPGHVDDLWRATQESLSELRPWLYWARSNDLGERMAFVQASMAAWEAGTDWVFALLLEGDAVGTIGLHEFDRTLEQAELGYWLRTDLGGRGLMTEAARAVVGFGFGDLSLHRIELHVAPGNVASLKVAERVGFRREGLLRDGSRGADGWHDAYVYGLLAGDARSGAGTAGR